MNLSRAMLLATSVLASASMARAANYSPTNGGFPAVLPADLSGVGQPQFSTPHVVGQGWRDTATGNRWIYTSNSIEPPSGSGLLPVLPMPDLMTMPFTVGTNLPGLDTTFNGKGAIPGFNYPIPTEAAMNFDYMRARGIRVVRVQFKWELLFSNGVTGAINTQYLGYMQQITAWAYKRSIGVFWDMHNYANYDVNAVGGQPQVGASGAPTYAQLAADWAQIATLTKAWPGVIGYDTMNEPVNVPDIAAMQQAIVTAIRSTGATQTILIEGNGFTSAGLWTANNVAMFGVTDPLNRLILEVHDYPDDDHSGTHQSYANQSHNPIINDPGGTDPTGYQPITVNTGAVSTAAFLSLASQHGHPRIMMGEVGASTLGTPWRTAVDNMISEVQGYGNSFVTLWQSGWYGYNTAAGYDVTPQATGSQLGNVVDKANVSNITKYTGFTAIPVGLVGPSFASAGAASAPFQVIAHGYIPTACTATLSDGGAGGTFTPAIITVPAGFNGSVDGMAEPALSATYTPPATPGTFTISEADTCGWVPPAPVGVSTLPDPLSTAVAAAGGTLQVVASTRAVVPGTITPLVGLRRTSDGAVLPIAQGAGTFASPVAVANFAGSSPVAVSAVTDQSPAGANPLARPATFDSYGYPAAQLSDQPTYSPTALNGHPGMVFANSRLASTISGLSAAEHACLLTTLQLSGATPQPFITLDAPDSSTQIRIPGNPASTGAAVPWVTLKMAPADTAVGIGTADASAAHTLALCVDTTAVRLFVDDVKTASYVAEPFLPIAAADHLRIGYGLNNGVYGNGTLGTVAIVTAPAALSDNQVVAISAAEGQAFGITVAAPASMDSTPSPMAVTASRVSFAAGGKAQTARNANQTPAAGGDMAIDVVYVPATATDVGTLFDQGGQKLTLANNGTYVCLSLQSQCAPIILVPGVPVEIVGKYLDNYSAQFALGYSGQAVAADGAPLNSGAVSVPSATTPVTIGQSADGTGQVNGQVLSASLQVGAANSVNAGTATTVLAPKADGSAAGFTDNSSGAPTWSISGGAVAIGSPHYVYTNKTSSNSGGYATAPHTAAMNPQSGDSPLRFDFDIVPAAADVSSGTQGAVLALQDLEYANSQFSYGISQVGGSSLYLSLVGTNGNHPTYNFPIAITAGTEMRESIVLNTTTGDVSAYTWNADGSLGAQIGSTQNMGAIQVQAGTIAPIIGQLAGYYPVYGGIRRVRVSYSTRTIIDAQATATGFSDPNGNTWTLTNGATAQ